MSPKRTSQYAMVGLLLVVATTAPNAVAFVLVLIISGFSDRLKARGPFMIWGCVVPIAGYVMLLASKRPAVQHGETFLVAWSVSRQSLRDELAQQQLNPSLCEGYRSWRSICHCQLYRICGHFHVPAEGCVSHPLSFHPKHANRE
jgi:hypothetical protein